MDDVDAVLPFVPMDKNIFPVQLKEIQFYETKDREFRQKIKNNPVHFQKEAVEQVKIVTYKNRIYVPKQLQTRIIKWYQHYLCNPGEVMMHKTMASTLYWKKMEDELEQFVKQCKACQRFKKQKIRNIVKYHTQGCRVNSLGYCVY